MTNATREDRVGAITTEGELDVSTPHTAAQHLQDILDRESEPTFDGSGCSDHVTRRNLRLTVTIAVILLVILVVLLVL